MAAVIWSGSVGAGPPAARCPRRAAPRRRPGRDPTMAGRGYGRTGLQTLGLRRFLGMVLLMYRGFGFPPAGTGAVRSRSSADGDDDDEQGRK